MAEALMKIGSRRVLVLNAIRLPFSVKVAILSGIVATMAGTATAQVRYSLQNEITAPTNYGDVSVPAYGTMVAEKTITKNVPRSLFDDGLEESRIRTDTFGEIRKTGRRRLPCGGKPRVVKILERALGPTICL